MKNNIPKHKVKDRKKVSILSKPLWEWIRLEPLEVKAIYPQFQNRIK